VRKVLIVAASEFTMAVRSRGFLIGLLLVPVLLGVALLMQHIIDRQADTRTRLIAVIDDTGSLVDDLERAAEAWNHGERDAGRTDANGPAFRIEHVRPGELPRREVLLALSERVRRDDLYAFAELPADLLETDNVEPLRYYSATPGYRDLPDWLHRTVMREVVKRRFEQAAVNPLVVAELVRPVVSKEFGLLARDGNGGIRQPQAVDRIRTLVIPATFMFVLFLIVMTTTPQLLNSVLEEKMSRISEVLLGSVAPFQLMMGKLLASTGISLVLATVYLIGAAIAASRSGYLMALSPDLVMWFLFFLVLAVLIYGSIFIAIGAACTDLRDAQSLMTPTMGILMVPVLSWTAITRAPQSAIAVGLSLFPPSTPFLMLLRLALNERPPAWQVALGVTLAVLATLGTVWAAGKIFRTGLLMQGKAATLSEIWRWTTADLQPSVYRTRRR
jgi:ABC-2 type transport system permease protein